MENNMSRVLVNQKRVLDQQSTKFEREGLQYVGEQLSHIQERRQALQLEQPLPNNKYIEPDPLKVLLDMIKECNKYRLGQNAECLTDDKENALSNIKRELEIFEKDLLEKIDVYLCGNNIPMYINITDIELLYNIIWQIGTFVGYIKCNYSIAQVFKLSFDNKIYNIKEMMDIMSQYRYHLVDTFERIKLNLIIEYLNEDDARTRDPETFGKELSRNYNNI